MKLLQVNTVLNSGSTGRITEGIGIVARDAGYESFAGYGKLGLSGTNLEGILIGTEPERYLHGIKTRLLDRHGFGSKRATREFIKKVEEINPDIIGLHNLHGYYLNVEILFNYLKRVQKPVVWTFHDCWPFTGHCVYFDRVGCEKWKTECHRCPQKKRYPASYGLDQSRKNFHQKRELFNGLENLTIVTPSHWLRNLVKESFLSDYPVEVIHNGIELDVFKPGKDHLPEIVRNIEKKIVLGVASTWDERKGLGEFEKLALSLDKGYQIVLVGLSEKQLAGLPDGITGMARTENVKQLASLYSAAEVYVNPTLSDNFPTTNIEALACGTPVVTYDTGGSPEAIDKETGLVVDQKDIKGVNKAIIQVSEKGKNHYRERCRERALIHFNKDERFRDYLDLYERMVEG